MQILTAETILNDDVFDELFLIEDEVERTKLYLQLVDRASELGVKGKFEKLYGAQNRAFKQYLKEQQQTVIKSDRNNITQYDSEYPALNCGTWECDMQGVRTFTMFGEVTACYHPIMPIKRLKNLQTGDEKVVVAFNRDGCWQEVVIDNSILLNANKITGVLSSKGANKTSETSRLLVNYFEEIMN